MAIALPDTHPWEVGSLYPPLASGFFIPTLGEWVLSLMCCVVRGIEPLFTLGITRAVNLFILKICYLGSSCYRVRRQFFVLLRLSLLVRVRVRVCLVAVVGKLTWLFVSPPAVAGCEALNLSVRRQLPQLNHATAATTTTSCHSNNSAGNHNYTSATGHHNNGNATNNHNSNRHNSHQYEQFHQSIGGVHHTRGRLATSPLSGGVRHGSGDENNEDGHHYFASRDVMVMSSLGDDDTIHRHSRSGDYLPTRLSSLSVDGDNCGDDTADGDHIHHQHAPLQYHQHHPSRPHYQHHHIKTTAIVAHHTAMPGDDCDDGSSQLLHRVKVEYPEPKIEYDLEQQDEEVLDLGGPVPRATLGPSEINFRSSQPSGRAPLHSPLRSSHPLVRPCDSNSRCSQASVRPLSSPSPSGAQHRRRPTANSYHQRHLLAIDELDEGGHHQHNSSTMSAINCILSAEILLDQQQHGAEVLLDDQQQQHHDSASILMDMKMAGIVSSAGSADDITHPGGGSGYSRTGIRGSTNSRGGGKGYAGGSVAGNLASTTSPTGGSSGGNVYPCLECHKVFRHPMSLHHHRHVHRGTYTCHSCTKVFSRRWDLHRHLHRSKLGCRRPSGASNASSSGNSADYSATNVELSGNSLVIAEQSGNSSVIAEQSGNTHTLESSSSSTSYNNSSGIVDDNNSIVAVPASSNSCSSSNSSCSGILMVNNCSRSASPASANAAFDLIALQQQRYPHQREDASDCVSHQQYKRGDLSDGTSFSSRTGVIAASGVCSSNPGGGNTPSSPPTKLGYHRIKSIGFSHHHYRPDTEHVALVNGSVSTTGNSCVNAAHEFSSTSKSSASATQDYSRTHNGPSSNECLVQPPDGKYSSVGSFVETSVLKSSTVAYPASSSSVKNTNKELNCNIYSNNISISSCSFNDSSNINSNSISRSTTTTSQTTTTKSNRKLKAGATNSNNNIPCSNSSPQSDVLTGPSN